MSCLSAQSSRKRAGREVVGHPVDVGSGVQFTAWEDIEVGGHFPLIWRRSYSTSFLADPPSVHGVGWKHGFDLRLRVEEDRYRFFGPNGEVIFQDMSGVVNTGGFLIDYGQALELRREESHYVVYHWHDWESEVHKFVFQIRAEPELRLHRIELPAGHGVRLLYDKLNRLTEIRQDIEQRGLLLEYGDSGALKQLILDCATFDRERICTYQYDTLGRLVGVIDATGIPLVYDYDDQHRLILEKDRLGGAYSMKYDSKGRCIEVGGDRRYGRRRIIYNENTLVTTVFDSLENCTIYKLNGYGQVESKALPDGAVTTTEFDGESRVMAEVAPDGSRTEFKYDSRGNLAETHQANGAVLKINYNDIHLPILITEADGAQWSLSYQNGALVGVTDPAGRKTVYVRNAKNVIEEIWTPAGNRLLVSRDEAWTKETYSDVYGLVTICTFDRRLNVTAVHNAHGMYRKFEYNNVSQLVALIEADGGQARYLYDAAGNLVKVIDPLGHITRMEYSLYSDCVAMINANGGVYQFTNDSEGRVIAITNPKGEVARFEYDPVGNLTKVVQFDQREESFLFDLKGRCTRRQKPDGTILEYSPTASGLIGRVSCQGSVLVSNTFDLCDQLTETVTPDSQVSFKYDPSGRVISEQQGDRCIMYNIGKDGFVHRCYVDKFTTGDLRFEYDKRGRLVSLTKGGKKNQTYDYDAADLMIRRHMGKVTEFIEHDQRQRVTRKKVKRNDGGEIVDRKFSYDSADNLVVQSDSVRGDVHYTYGPTGLLLQSNHSRRGRTEYHYDVCGNIRLKGNEPLDYDGGNRLVRVAEVRHQLDANGRRLSSFSEENKVTYVWDPLDQLVKVVDKHGLETRYLYDGLGRRTSKICEDVATRYYWGGDNLLREERGDSVVEYAIGEFLPDLIWQDGLIRHVLRSYRGEPCELLDDKGQVVWKGDYDDWGALIESSGKCTQNLRLPGQYCDGESFLHYNRFRYYDPRAGRFISPDPLGLAAGANVFLYAPNPINWTDPYGLYCGKKGCRNTVYVLRKNGKIVYVGITSRAALTRMKEHARGGKSFDEMRVVATGLTRRQARNIEGSALMHAESGQLGGAVSGANMQNAKTSDGGLYHAYDGSTSGPGRVVYTPAQSTTQVGNTLQDSSGNPVVYPNP